MKGFAKLLIMGGLLAVSAAPAFADEVDASATGTLTYNSSTNKDTLTLNNGNVNYSTFAGVTTGAITFGGPFVFTPNSSVSTMNVLLYTQGSTQFFMTSLVEGPGVGNNNPIVAYGNGYFLIGGTQVAATYQLNSSGGYTQFTTSFVTSPTPEPSSLVLLGTGLLGAAGVAFRKRLTV